MLSTYGRAVLNTPATSPDRFASAHASGADLCVVDLEDAVPPQRKAEARELAAAFFTAPPGTRCAIRVNAVTEPDGLRDLLAVAAYPVPPSAVLVPKVESARDIEIVAAVLAADIELLAVVETPRGVQRLAEIAGASPRLRALIFGAADYAAALGVDVAWAPLAHVRANLVNCARAAGIHAIDAPTFDVTDTAPARADAELARALGFDGKIALHPRQVPVLTEVFSPRPADLARARRVVAAGAASGQGVTTIDGTMVGRPFFEASQRLLDTFGPQRQNPVSVLPSLDQGVR